MNFCFQGCTKIPTNYIENMVDILIGREYTHLQLHQIAGYCHT